MTISEELREWATCDESANVNRLTYNAWWHLICLGGDAIPFDQWGLADDRRTFALLVAEAMESEE